MKASTKLKRYMGSDTATRRSSRWFRIGSQNSDIEQLFDLYWGGKERRITGLTLRIIGVNAFAVVGLIFGVVYLGQYHSTLIESKLKRFETEILLVATAVAEGAIESSDGSSTVQMSKEKAKLLSARLGATLEKRILIFNAQDDLVADSETLIEQNSIKPFYRVITEEKKRLDSVEILKKTAAWVASIFPQHNKLSLFPGVSSQSAQDYSDVVDAKNKNLSMSAWQDEEGKVVLTAALPILQQAEVVGVVMLIGDDGDINQDLADTWFNILKIFLVTFFITILLSIYLAGVIARPLRKLASASENVRKGKIKHTEIPDMSDRHDEIGELSLVLRDMTAALWERMDTIEAFAADVSHEIKNPLTSLKSAVETASVVKKKADIDKLLMVIKHDVDRLDRLITDISNASRLDAELSREAFDEINLKRLLQDLINVYKRPLDRNSDLQDAHDEVLHDGVMITLSMPSTDNIFVLGSEGRLIQVFQNIIANALSFAPVKSTIKIKCSLKDHQITISIEDEGPGIPENKLQTIFERFYSERPEHEEYGRHSGLGLSICKQIIIAHNGKIYAENKTDKNGDVSGAKFVIILNNIRSKETK